MVLLPEQGDVAETPLPRLLLDLYRARFSGSVTLSRARVEKTFLFQEGIPIYAESNLASESLGVQLLDAKLISRNDYAQVTSYVQTQQCKEGKALLDLELLAPKQLFVALKDQVRRRMVECFSWVSGQFQVEMSDAPPEDAQPFRADIYSLVQEGIEAHWGAERILGDLSDKLKLHPERTAELARLQPRLRWDDAVQAFVDALDGRSTLWDALQLANTPRAMAAAWLLDTADAIEYRDEPAEVEKDPSPEIEIVARAQQASGTGARATRAPAGAGQPARPNPAAEKLRREIERKFAHLGELGHYELLGLELGAEPAEIKRAYLAAAKSYHPDALSRLGLGPELRQQANKVFAEIGRAYSVLSDPAARRDYEARRYAGEADEDGSNLVMAETLYRKAQVLLRLGNFAGALEFLAPAVELWPDDATYRSELGWALYKKMPSEPAAAREHLEAASRLESQNGVVFFRLGVVLRALGETAAANGAIEKAKRLDPRIKI